MEVVVEPCERVLGEVEIPGDKSLSHRSVMLAALANFPTHISGFLPGLDTLATVNALQTVGIRIQFLTPTECVVYGQGIDHFNELLANKSFKLDFQNAGTGIRLFSGLLASATGQIILTGDESLCKRPMKRITDPLSQMGVDITGERAPLYFNLTKANIRKKLTPLNYVLPQASAQVKSCLLLAGLFTEGKTTLTEPIPTRDHTERMLKEFGAKITKQGQDIFIEGHLKDRKLALKNNHYEIVKDFSSAAFFIVAALIANQGNIVIRKIGLNPTRTGLLTVLLSMSADIQIHNEMLVHNEPIGDLHITNKNQLRGAYVSSENLALMIDEFPIFLLAALKASEPTVIEGIQELAYKESNRVETMVKNLIQFGAKFDLISAENKLIVYPLISSNLTCKSEMNIDLDCAKDHRVAMSLFMASLLVRKQVKIQDVENINTSFPHFFEEAKKVGFCFKIITHQGGAKCLQ